MFAVLAFALTLTAGVFTGTVQNQVAPVAPADIKGWRGAEWAMTPDQVNAATGLSLETVKEIDGGKCGKDQGDLTVLQSARSIEVGKETAQATFCFGPKGLKQVTLDLGPSPAAYPTIRDELISVYGKPVSESSNDFAGRSFTINQSKWLLAHTEIRCTASESRTPKVPQLLEVTYTPRQKSVL